uniref:DNA polymerase alpha subunit B n=2 Tax=Scylla olivacea TaxID=85551 RepID=A0A0P4WMW3_SCYOL
MADQEEGLALHISEVIEEFSTFGVTLSDEAANQCLALCKQYGVDGEQLAVLWLTFASTHGYDSVTLEALEHLDRVEQNSSRKKAAAEAASASTVNRLNASLDNGCLSRPEDDDDEDILEAYGGSGSGIKAPKQTLTPKNEKPNGKVRSISAQFRSATLSPTVASPSLKYSSRTNSGTVVVQYGAPDNTTWTANPDFHPEVKLVGCFDEPPLTKAYNFMYERPGTIGEVLSDMTLSLAEEMQDIMLKKGKKGEEEEEEYSSVNTMTSEAISTVGRVCCDCSSHLNAASVLVEGCMEDNKSSVVQLDLSQVKGFSLFPGQIMGIRGSNPTGNKLLAQELVDGKLPPEPTSPITISTSTGPIQLVVASGPFTTSSNLLYEPLTDFLTAVRNNPPHVLVLLGPFLDAGHPLVVGNDLGETHDAVFNRCLHIISTTLESTPTQVILVPSSRDVCSPMVYPTPPYDVAGNFTCVSDPALVNIEGVVVALTATDVLFHLGKEEISSASQDRLVRLTRHILKQRSLYPLYPPHESMCVVMEQLENYVHLPYKPHLLVIPSDLHYFAKEVEGCVVVNPEHLAKGLIGGTYARIELHPPSSDKRMVNSINVNVLKV